MAWQLVYTSAPVLLDVGRTGFGTVARHEEIRPALQSELERISQFSREQGLSKERILFYHRVLDLRGERFYVLSRIRDAGSDYTGRTNHIAQHIVLTEEEAALAGAKHCTPADMILWITSQRVWRDQWNAPPRLLSPTEKIAVEACPPQMERPAATWGSVTGLAENAAILAPGGSAMEGCWLLYGDEQASQLLHLISESLCLHPNPWAVSFGTDVQPTDRIEEIRWRGVCLGSPLEGTARQSVRPHLDLTQTDGLGLQPVPEFIHLARTGEKPPSPPLSAQVTHGRARAGQQDAYLPPTREGTAAGGSVSLRERMKSTQPPAKGTPRKRRGLTALWIVCSSTLLLLVAAICGGYYCVLDQKEIAKLANPTGTIVNKITKDKRSDLKEGWEKWYKEYKEEVKVGALNDYLIVSPATKKEVQVAIAKLGALQKVSDTNELAAKVADENQQAPPGLWGKVVGKIHEAKVEANRIAHEEEMERKKKKAERLAQEETERAARLALEKERKTQEEARLAEESRRKEESQKAQQPKAIPSKITAIAFKQLQEGVDPATELFPGNQFPADAVAWSVADASTNPMIVDSAWKALTTKWDSNTPSAKRADGDGAISAFNSNIKRRDSTAFATKDKSNNISVTILYKPEKTWTNTIDGGVFLWDEKSKEFVLNPQIKSFVEVATKGGCKTHCYILEGTNSIKDIKLDKGESLAAYSKIVASKKDRLEKDIHNYSPDSNHLKKGDNKPVSPDMQGKYAQLETNVVALFEGLKPYNNNQPAQKIEKFSDWLRMKGRNDQKTEANYKEYLQEALSYTDKYFNGNAHFSNSFNKLKSKSFLQKTDQSPIEKCFDSMKAEIKGYQKTCDDRPRSIKEADTIFIRNLDKIFSLDVANCKDYFDPPPPPDNSQEFKKQLKLLEEILKGTMPGTFQKYKPKIEILDASNNKVMTFITP